MKRICSAALTKVGFFFHQKHTASVQHKMASEIQGGFFSRRFVIPHLKIISGSKPSLEPTTSSLSNKGERERMNLCFLKTSSPRTFFMPSHNQYQYSHIHRKLKIYFKNWVFGTFFYGALLRVPIIVYHSL